MHRDEGRDERRKKEMGTQDQVAERRMGLPRKRKEGEEDGMEEAEGSA